ncbi:MAG: YbjQ family protein [Candidatus Thalassarchaeaceae archaeon]|mgnify:FL=1|tara:strand:+ start:1735 stop:2070 length:336 start_codon:yes stop_codon:yes gene_type:complete
MPSTVDGIYVVSTETIPGLIIKDQLGVVSGSTVRAKNVVRDFTQMLKNIVGGELPQYTELLVESRNEAFTRMVADAKARGANGVVNLRFATSAVSPGAAELFCYGTAVVTE